MELNQMTISELSDGLAKKKWTSRQLTEACLNRIETQKEINAFNTVCKEQALKQADETDARIGRGEKLSPIAGIPVAVKDNIATDGIRTTCSSKMLENFIPPYDAYVVKKLKENGAVIIGKTNMDEFAMGSSNETSYFGGVLNPVDKTRVPGGSSGGSAAAVADSEAIASLGSDTGGSIRQPASLCGVVGLKPTYGSVSRYGLIAFASSLDQIGTFTRSVRDAALMLNVITGHDPMDSTSADAGQKDYTANIERGVKGMKIGVAKEFFLQGLCDEVESTVKGALKTLEKAGAEIVDISIPYMDEMLSVYYIISSAEAASNLARFDGVKYGFRADKTTDIVDLYTKSRSQGFGDEVKRRIMLGNYVLSSGYYDAYYLKALKVRTLIMRAYRKAFEKCDIIASPTSPCTAFRIGEKCGSPTQMYLSDIYTVSSNIIGSPALSIPCGVDSQKLPVGLQLIGKPFQEEDILTAAQTFEAGGAAQWITK